MREKKARFREAITTVLTDQYEDLQPMTCVHNTHGQMKRDITIFDKGHDDNLSGSFVVFINFNKIYFMYTCMPSTMNKLVFEDFFKILICFTSL